MAGPDTDLDAVLAEGENAEALQQLARRERKHERNRRDLQILVRALQSQNEDLQSIVEALTAASESPPQTIRIDPAPRQASPVIPLVLASDHHIEEVVQPHQTNGRNEYTPDIAWERFQRFLENSAKLICRESETSSIAEAVFWLGGDFMSGHIHEDLVEVTAMTPTEATTMLFGWWSGGLRYLLDELPVERLIVPTSFGNHGRITKGRPRIATGSRHNLEQHLYRLLAKHFEDEPRIQFHTIDSAFCFVELGDIVVRFHHGDRFSFGGGVGGLTIPLNKAIARWNQETHADYDCFGHWHQWCVGPNFMGNGSLIGASEYSRSFGYEDPQQLLAFFDLERGLRAGVYPVFVD